MQEYVSYCFNLRPMQVNQISWEKAEAIFANNPILHASNIMGLNIPNIVFIVCFAVIGTVIGLLLFKPKKPWRIKASKKWLVRFRKNKTVYSAAQRFAYIRKIDHFLWEEVIMSCFEERGYKIVRTKMTRDGGSDGFVKINSDYIVIQAKRYKGQIAKSHVLDLDDLIDKIPGVNKGLFIHTGKTSGPIRLFFKSTENIDVIGGVDNVLRFLDGEPIKIFNQVLNIKK